MKRGITAAFFIFVFITNLQAQIEIVDVSGESNQIHTKLQEAYQIADGLIYRFEKLDRPASEDFLHRVKLLDLENLKMEADKCSRRELVDEKYYHFLFVEFPDRFDDYVKRHLLSRISACNRRAIRMQKREAPVLAINLFDASINMTKAVLHLQPMNQKILALKKTAEDFKAKVVDDLMSKRI